MAQSLGGGLAARSYAEIFPDLHPPLGRNEARVAAERCLFCYDAPCVTACPTSIDVPLFIRQITTGNPVGAAKTILDQNIMGAMCARVCPTENLCEGACVRAHDEGRPVEIGRLQRFATDDAFAAGEQFYRQGQPSGRTVAVVGAGPAGLACAHGLAVLGHSVVVFDAAEKAGGLNEFGIAAYKATGGIAQQEVDYILGVGGITVEHGRRLGETLSLPELRRRHDAVFLGLGLGATNRLGLADEDAHGVEDAVEWIAQLRQANDLGGVPVGRRVVVVGGGMTAIDAATQAKLLGAEEVTIAYRRTVAAMPASAYEQDVARTRGVVIRERLSPRRIVVENDLVAAVEFDRVADETLRPTGEVVVLPCDQLLKAIGQAFRPDDAAAAGGSLAMRGGRILVDGDRRTSLSGVYAGGDCIYGAADLTVVAVEDGKQAARTIDRDLRAVIRVAAE